MSIVHLKNLTIADGTNTDVVRPSDWNSGHQVLYNLSGNTVGSSQVSGADVIFVGGTNITLSADTAASKMHIIGPNAGGGVAMSRFPVWPVGLAASSCVSGTSNTVAGGFSTTAAIYVTPQCVPFDVNYQEIEMYLSNAAFSAGTGSGTIGHHLGIYTLNGGSALSLVSSFQNRADYSVNSATAVTGRWFYGTDSTNATATGQISGNVSASFTGMKAIKFYDASATLPAGNYWFAHCMTARSSSVNVCASFATAVYMSASNTTGGPYLGASSSAAPLPFRLLGSVSTVQTGVASLQFSMPTSIHTSAITNTGGSSQWRVVQPFFYN